MPDWSIEIHDTLTSTQDVIKGMASAMNIPEGRVVQAYEQTGGYGRHGREWVSRKGNLYLSVLMRPDCSLAILPQLSFVAVLSAYETVADLIARRDDLAIKWPNDLLLEGRKCAGILVESDMSHSGAVRWAAIGIGMNIRHAPPDIACAVQDYASQFIDLINARNLLLGHLGRYYHRWQTQGFKPIRELWLERAIQTGSPMKIKLGSREQEGYFYDIDETGNLILRDNDLRLQTITAGDVILEQKE